MRAFRVRCGAFDEEVAFGYVGTTWEEAERLLAAWIASEPSLAGATWERLP